MELKAFFNFQCYFREWCGCEYIKTVILTYYCWVLRFLLLQYKTYTFRYNFCNNAKNAISMNVSNTTVQCNCKDVTCDYIHTLYIYIVTACSDWLLYKKKLRFFSPCLIMFCISRRSLIKLSLSYKPMFYVLWHACCIWLVLLLFLNLNAITIDSQLHMLHV